MAQVSDVLAGTWERRPNPRGRTYLSNRGAGFGTTEVGAASKAGLEEARSACVAGAEPMKAAGEDFVCLERRSSGDLVVGNTLARGRLWVVVLAPRSGGIHEAELGAMLALMNAMPVKRWTRRLPPWRNRGEQKGHASMRAALIHQHATAQRDRAIAQAMDRLVEGASRTATEEG